MDLSFGPEYRDFRDEVKIFLAKHGSKAPSGTEAGYTKKGRAWQKLLIESGYAARTIPKEYGGYGTEPKHRYILALGRIQQMKMLMRLWP